MDRRLFILYECFFKSMRKHPIDTILGLGNILLNQAVSMIFLYVIFANVPALDNWRQYELLLIYGLFVLHKGIANFFTTSLYSIEQHIADGSFDGMLIRPVPPIYQILGESLEIGELVNIVIGGTVITISLVNIDEIDILWTLIILILFAILSVILFFSIRLICMSIAFWTLTSFPVAIAVDNISEFAKYPSSIYSKGISIILDFVIPFSIIAYFPTLIIIEKNIILLFVSIFITIIMLCISIFVWKCGIKSYKSSGH